MSMKSGIYQIRNSVNEKLYIGSSSDIPSRCRKHYSDLRNNQHQNQHLQNSFNKYGENCFDFSILHYCDVDMLTFFEQYFVDDYSVNRLYNIREIVDSNRGIIKSVETRRKISDGNKGKKHTVEHKEKLRLLMIGNTFALGSNSTAKHYQITFINGDIDIIRNLREYSRLNRLSKTTIYRLISGEKITPYKNIASICRM